MAWVPFAMQAVGSATQGVGSYLEGMDQSYAYKYNARLSELQAEEAQLAGDIELSRIKEEGKSLLSTQRMMYAKSGVMNTGSALDVEMRSAKEVAQDELISQFNTALTVRDYLSQRDQNLSAASSAKQSAKFSLISGFLMAGGQAAQGVSTAISNSGSTKIPTRSEAVTV